MNRNKEIKKFCRALEVYWIMTPELRFGQLPSRLSFELNTGDLFYLLDKELYGHLDKTINRRKA